MWKESLWFYESKGGVAVVGVGDPSLETGMESEEICQATSKGETGEHCSPRYAMVRSTVDENFS